MKTLIRTMVILGAMYSSASQAGDVEKAQKNLIAAFDVVDEIVKRSAPLGREEFHLVSDRFRDDERFVHNLSSELGVSEFLSPAPPKDITRPKDIFYYRRDIFLDEVKSKNVPMATEDIMSWISIMRSLNGILLTEASLDSSREKELRDLYDAQSRDLSILAQEFNAWLSALSL